MNCLLNVLISLVEVDSLNCYFNHNYTISFSIYLFSLKEEFPVWYEKLVLEMVHHNTISLEKLVDTSWLEIMTKFAVDEECDFEVRTRFISQKQLWK